MVEGYTMKRAPITLDAVPVDAEVLDAKEFLREQLADGPKLRAEVMAAGKKEGHAERTLRRARREIEISNSAIWALPAEHAPKGAEG